MSAPDQYALIGQPVAHSRSPQIHALFAQQTGQRLSYRAIEVAPEQLGARVHEFFAQGGRGLNVTLPHKQAVMMFADQLSERAQAAGAVNTLSMDASGAVTGDNTDGIGLVRDLTQHLGVAVTGMRVLLLGAGGAARGVLAPLLQLRPRQLLIANRSVERAQRLVQESAGGDVLGACGYDQLEQQPFDLIINATSAGLQGQSLPLSQSLLHAHTLCYDMTYGSASSFLQWAQAHNAGRSCNGLGMLVEQAAESFFIWRGVRPQTAPVRAALAASLA